MLTAAIALLTPVLSEASTPYKTYTMDGYGYVSETQSAYSPDSSITKIGDYSFSSPSDMVVTDDGFVYVADTGNKRILISDLEGNYVNTVGEGELVAPTGIYVTEDKTLYVADKDGKKVVVYNSAGVKINEYGKPDHPLYGGKVDFKPQKIVVNRSGNMYIICEGNTNGIVQISPTDGGTFIGYFGTNYTSVTLLQMFQRMIFTDEQKAKMLSNLPSTPTNLSVDEQGLIYTVTQGENIATLKKLNIAGNNLIEPDAYDELPAAVTTGNFENIFVASQDGYIYEYSDDGEMLFVFGGRDDGRGRIGLCGRVVAMGIDPNNRIYVLDGEKQQIHIFKPTEFTNLLHEALYLYGKGRYTESKEPLTKVLEMNSLFDYANKAMGRAYYQEENYSEALRYARLAKDWTGYSNAFWEIRNDWIRENLIISIVIIVVLLGIITFLKRKKDSIGFLVAIRNKTAGFKERRLISQLRYAPQFMKHPFDGCYAVKREGKDSYLCANIILAGVIVLSIIGKYGCGFLLKNVRDGYYDLVGDIGKVVIIFLVLIVCNYLMCTINDGESKFRQLYCGYAYALTPYLFFKPVGIILSNVVTFSEVFLVEFTYYFMYAWILILLFIALKEINNYSFKESIKNILLTAFTVLIVALVAFILYILFSQVVEFVVKIVGEVAYRFE